MKIQYKILSLLCAITVVVSPLGVTTAHGAEQFSKKKQATALCGDGTYSYSKTRRGTCSHHGGVTVWYPVMK